MSHRSADVESKHEKVKMKKGFFIAGNRNVSLAPDPSGVERKVAAQIKALNMAGLYCPQVFCSKFNDLPAILSVILKVLSRLPFLFIFGEPLHYDKVFDQADFIYIRRSSMSLTQLLALRKIRRHNPKAKILYEIPTYPYKKELTKRWLNYPFWWREALYMPLLHPYVDRIVTVSSDDEIYGIPTIKMVNGIDISTIAPIIPQPEDGAIHIIAVAMITPWHGYDRFMRAMSEYYKAGGIRRVVLHIVGYSQINISLESLIGKLGLGEHVILHGYKTGTELDAIYNRCHLGLISLATQDKDIYIHSTLKSREYLAKGLPTIATGMTDVFIGKNYTYNLELPLDKEINLRKIIDFYDRIYSHTDRERVIAEIRTFAERTIDINTTMAPVVSYLRDEKQES